MEKIKLVVLGSVASLTLAFVSPASAFSLGAAMHDISKSTLLAAAASPLASFGNRIGCSVDGAHCAQINPRAETFANGIRFAVYRAAPETEIFTGSIPKAEQASVEGQRFPAFAIGYNTQHSWPALLRPKMTERAVFAQPDTFPASQKTPELISL